MDQTRRWLSAAALGAAAIGVTAAPAAAATKPSTTPEAPKAGGTLSLSLSDSQHPSFAFTGDRLTLRGTVSKYVPGQSVRVRLYRGPRKLAVVSRHVAAGKLGRGAFTATFKLTGRGKLTIMASHRASKTQKSMTAKKLRIQVVSPNLQSGSQGPAVRFLQTRLSTLHYVTGSGGVFDAGTQRSVIAYRKVLGIARNTAVDRSLFTHLEKSQGNFHVRFPNHGHHAEGDLGHQVLALINGDKVERVYMMSSGKPSTPTILGTYRVYSKTPGTNAKGMVDSSYFIRGYAIHGYAEVPIYNASHGCLRVPVPNARSIYDWIRMGDIVDTYY